MNYIYTIRNIITGDVYVGQTNCPRKRFYLHKRTLRENRHCNPYLQRSYCKYGPEAFVYSVVEECDGFEQANALEECHISALRTANIRVYNLRAGGRNGALSDEHKRKIGDALRGRPKSEAHKRKVSEGLRGKIQSEETKQKRIESRKGYKHSEETKLKMSQAHKKRRA